MPTGKKIEAKYPVYDKDQNLNCKLKDEDIDKIKYLLGQGHKKTWIAKLMGINRSTIYYHFDGGLTKSYQQKWQKRHYSTPKNHYDDYGKKYLQRKKQLQGKEFRNFDAYYHKLRRTNEHT